MIYFENVARNVEYTARSLIIMSLDVVQALDLQDRACCNFCDSMKKLARVLYCKMEPSCFTDSGTA